jgi:hypothetical protein
MAYLRGSTYIWSDGERIHLWSQDGLDHWQQTGFGEHPEASGVALREAVMDQFVCMRFAELAASGKLEVAVRSALEAGSGNSGCTALSELGSTIVDRLGGLSEL